MTPASTRKKGREYRYYRCVTRDKQGKDACVARQVPAGAIECFVVDRIREATAGGNLARDVAARLNERIQEQRQVLQTERKELPQRIASLSATGRRLVESLGDLKPTARRLLEQRVEELGEELARHEARLTALHRELASLRDAAVEVKWVVKALSHFDDVWESMTPENRQRLVRAIVERVEVNEPEGRIAAVLVDLEQPHVAAEQEGSAA